MITAMDTLCTMMQTMNSSAGNAWTDASRLGYEIALDGIADELIFQVAKHAVKTCAWRPAPSGLLDIAARLASPLPDENEVVQEIRRISIGGTGYDKASPLSTDVVKSLGDWWEVSRCNNEFLDKKIRDAYKIEVIRWEKIVKEQLSLPEAARDAKYFPKQEKHIEQKVRLEIAS